MGKFGCAAFNTQLHRLQDSLCKFIQKEGINNRQDVGFANIEARSLKKKKKKKKKKRNEGAKMQSETVKKNFFFFD
jgi:hypothetical protein